MTAVPYFEIDLKNLKQEQERSSSLIQTGIKRTSLYFFKIFYEKLKLMFKNHLKSW